MKVPAHEATTAQLAAAYPFAASASLPTSKVLVGRDLLGGRFVHDPFELYANGALTNPNLLVLGQIGRGKSALVKSYLYRQAAFGRRIVVLDPKGEYGPLAAALGSEPIALKPGGRLRLNPLGAATRMRDAGEADPAGPARRRLALCSALAAACLGRDLAPLEHGALEEALSATSQGDGPPLLGAVVDALLAPTPDAASRLRLGVTELRDGGRDLGLALRRLVHGELAGMFDGPTTPGLDLGAAAVVLDLSALYTSSALGVLVACAAAAVEASWRDDTTHKRLLVVDEAWAVLADPAVAGFVQSAWKLARAHGSANVAVVHRVSDLAASGDAGSRAARLADGLVADSETIVCYAQPHAEIPAAREALGLSDEEATLLPTLARGVALWRVGGRSFLVEHRIGRDERRFVGTDEPLSSGEVAR